MSIKQNSMLHWLYLLVDNNEWVMDDGYQNTGENDSCCYEIGISLNTLQRHRYGKWIGKDYYSEEEEKEDN